MVTDIVPGMLSKILQEFSQTMPRIECRTYADANQYAQECGEALSAALRKYVTSDVLPDGRMYYNIAERVMNGSLKKDYEVLAEISENVQTLLNQEAGIGLKAVVPKLDKDRINGIVERLSEAENFDDVFWLLGAPVVNFSRSVVDDAVRANFELQGEAGLSPKVVRVTDGKCCDWCSGLAGTHEYPCSREVYQRHENCGCLVEYIAGKTRTNVWTKKSY